MFEVHFYEDKQGEQPIKKLSSQVKKSVKSQSKVRSKSQSKSSVKKYDQKIRTKNPLIKSLKPFTAYFISPKGKEQTA